MAQKCFTTCVLIASTLLSSCDESLVVACDYSAQTVIGVGPFSADRGHELQRSFNEAIAHQSRLVGAEASDISVCTADLPANALWQPGRDRDYNDVNWAVFHGRVAITETEHDFVVWGAAPDNRSEEIMWFATEDQDEHPPTDGSFLIASASEGDGIDRAALWTLVAALESKIETLPPEPRRTMARELIQLAAERGAMGRELRGYAEMASALLYPRYMLSGDTGEATDNLSMETSYVLTRETAFLSGSNAYRVATEFWPDGQHPAGLERILDARSYYLHAEARDTEDFEELLGIIDRRQALLSETQELTIREVSGLDLERARVLYDHAHAMADLDLLEAALWLVADLRTRAIPEGPGLIIRDNLAAQSLAGLQAEIAATGFEISRDQGGSSEKQVQYLEQAVLASSSALEAGEGTIFRHQRLELQWLRARAYLRLADLLRDRELLDRADQEFEELARWAGDPAPQEWLDDMTMLERVRSELG
ncbi:MAG: hypothetical protein JJ884_09605 [Maricaulis sp.]|uniref:hypothetical protein n=1 Tax=Maricaulis sp. TaxID=1486257 RepID=UPI001B0EF099|nr:hypothetical protein [Maricaulis sp.]MBO6847759.1 hypothetical protein [Maricaulis sp.]MBO6877386.1 hypothetical protein [Maricaulis sp.]